MFGYSIATDKTWVLVSLQGLYAVQHFNHQNALKFEDLHYKY